MTGAPCFRPPSARAITVVLGVLGVLAVAGCGSGPLTVSAATVALPAHHGSLPAITGGGVRALWQADWLGSYPVVSDGLVIADWRAPAGAAGPAGPANATVAAVKAATGAAAWAVTLPSSLPDILGLVPAGHAVVVEAGHDIGQAPFAVFPVVTELLVLDQATGRQLWAAPVGGDYQQPPVVTAAALVVTGDPSGAVTARRVTTGTVVWRAPAACPLLTTDTIPPVTLAADGSLIAESISCDPSEVIRRLDPATGQPRWTWRSPAAINSGNHFVSVAASDGAVILVDGLGDPASFGSTWSAVGLPKPYPWPSQVGPQDSHATGSFTLALDPASGRPRWSQASFGSYALTTGALCGVIGVNGGIQCRDDVTGATTMPDFVPAAVDQAYVADGLAVITSASAPGGGTELTVLAVRGGAVTARAQLAVKAYTYDTHQVYPPEVVASGALPGGGYLVLLQRRDLPDTPTLALRLGAAG